jgi:hypothetical protein
MVAIQITNPSRYLLFRCRRERRFLTVCLKCAAGIGSPATATATATATDAAGNASAASAATVAHHRHDGAGGAIDAGPRPGVGRNAADAALTLPAASIACAVMQARLRTRDLEWLQPP